MIRFVMLSILVLGASCPAPNTPPEDSTMSPASSSATFRLLHESTYSRSPDADSSRDPRIEVATSGTELRALWNLHIGEAARPLPPVDFDRESVLFLFLGSRRSGGYSIVAEKVWMESDVLKVQAREKTPERGSMVTMALTSPFIVIAVDKPEVRAVDWTGQDGRIMARATP